MCSTNRVLPQPVGPFEHHRKPAGVARLENRHFVADRQVVRRLPAGIAHRGSCAARPPPDRLPPRGVSAHAVGTRGSPASGRRLAA